MKKLKAALLAAVMAGFLGAGAAPASATQIEGPCQEQEGGFCPDSHWMAPGDPPDGLPTVPPGGTP
ncbi:hypothetical protein [Streptosporangium subroseum]|uniref:hypothetical protein n=1 Tax=Streptosporangium subroseum TaxID=106412 RepID=UPI0030857D9D|nr:hypothetical protein OHB15_08265 [Streptosporangium subroseum]